MSPSTWRRTTWRDNENDGNNDNDAENAESEDVEETEGMRYHRYLRSDFSELSDPDIWMKIHHQSEVDAAETSPMRESLDLSALIYEPTENDVL